MNRTTVEYIWIDNKNELRGKTMIYDHNIDTLNQLVDWTFDGSSTGQATGHFSDVIIRPIKMFTDPFIDGGKLCLCETYIYNEQMMIVPHSSNKRNSCKNAMDLASVYKPWFGIEQEYLIIPQIRQIPQIQSISRHKSVRSSISNLFTGKIDSDTDHYCGMSTQYRNIAVEHMNMCLRAGVKICGINAEVTKNQWEFQIGICEGIDVCDHLWMARYLLYRVLEKYDLDVTYYPKPIPGINGSGAHTNFSTVDMRSDIINIYTAIEKLRERHHEHMPYYGIDNHLRLTGLNETSSIDTFTYGIGNRGASIRIPLHVSIAGKGYLEDRRPASNSDPYVVTKLLVETVCI